MKPMLRRLAVFCGALMVCAAGAVAEEDLTACPAGATFSQAVDTNFTGTVFSSNNVTKLQVYDLITGVDEPIIAVRWWGITAGQFGADCAPTSNTYRVSFHSRGGVFPSGEITHFDVTPTVTDTGLTVAGEKLWAFDATLSSSVTLPNGEGFISVHVPSTSGDCRFSWANAAIGTGSSLTFNSNINVLDWSDNSDDVAFCLVTAPGEGEGGNEGEPDPLISCGPQTAFANLPDFDISGTMFASHDLAQLQVYDEFRDVNEPITSVRWWGFTGNAVNTPCAGDSQSFRISFHAAGVSFPGVEQYSFTATPTVTPTGRDLFVELQISMFEVYLPQPYTPEGGDGWISIYVPNTSNNCRFNWVNGAVGDGSAVQFNSNTGELGYETVPDDVAFCLGTGPIPEGEGSEEGEQACTFPLTGAQQFPTPVITAATGTGVFLTDIDGNLTGIQVTHTVANPLAAHIHSGAAGSNGGVIIDFGNATSPIVHMFTPEEITLLRNTPAFYVNVHSGAFSSGEIRGQAEQCLPPEPAEGEGDVEGVVEGVEEGVEEGEDIDPLGCAEGSAFSQLPDLGPLATVYSSNNTTKRQVYELIRGVHDPITKVRWWGITATAALGNCDPATNSYKVGFSERNVSLPGGGIIEFTVTPTVVDTGVTVIGEPLYMFEATLPSSVTLPNGEGYLSVYVASTQNDCRFSWASADIGDGRSQYFNRDVQVLDWFENEDDVAFCLVTEPGGEGGNEGAEGEPNAQLECAGDVAQLPDPEITATFYSSNNAASRQVYDRVTGADRPITAIRWWGVATLGGGSCDPATQIYTVEFTQDGVTYPGGGIAAYSLNPTITATGTTVAGFPLYVFDATLPQPVTLPDGNGYVSIHVPSTTNNCRFSWANADLGDGGAVAFVSGALTWEFPADDVAWCLTLEEPPAEGEGTPEGITEGEGAQEGEGVSEGEGNVEGEGAAEGEGVAEGEGEPLDAYDQALYTYASADTDSDGKLTLSELQAQLPQFGQVQFEALDSNNDGFVSVAELLDFNGEGIIHSGDTNGDFLISLNELLRMIQLYNAGEYSCAELPGDTEDGFVANGDGPSDCVLHALDRNLDGVISLSELLRGIQLYSLGGYQFCEGQSEDGFCAQDG